MADDVLNRLADDWKGLREIVVYGFGKVAQRNIGKLYRDFTIKYIVDNGADKADQQYRGIPVQPFADVKDKITRYKVIVCTSSLAYASIQKDLQSIGLKEYEDYVRLEDFMPEWYWKYRGEVVISQMSSSITSKCTLNCRDCKNSIERLDETSTISKAPSRRQGKDRPIRRRLVDGSIRDMARVAFSRKEGADCQNAGRGEKTYAGMFYGVSHYRRWETILLRRIVLSGSRWFLENASRRLCGFNTIGRLA